MNHLEAYLKVSSRKVDCKVLIVVIYKNHFDAKNAKCNVMLEIFDVFSSE